MFRVFNMGIGYILVDDRDQAMRAVESLARIDVPAYPIGHIMTGPRSVRLVTPQ